MGGCKRGSVELSLQIAQELSDSEVKLVVEYIQSHSQTSNAHAALVMQSKKGHAETTKTVFG